MNWSKERVKRRGRREGGLGGTSKNARYHHENNKLIMKILKMEASSGRPGPWASRTGADEERLPWDAGDEADNGRVRLAIDWAAPGTRVRKSAWA